MDEERVPETIGRYQIRRELGRGMMGVVYEAYDPSLHRSVALKVVRLLFAITEADREGFERRFLSEAQIAARLSHSGIVVVHDVGRDPQTGILYIALERLQGRTLADMTGERLPWRQALQITAQVAQALGYAHGQGVVHRDIKPANVMVLPTGEVKIMDFGLAKHEAGHDLTQAGQFVGTPLFMAPEQVLGLKVDGRTDLFSLGSVLYTLLTGARAFAADSVPRIMSRVAHEEPRPATELAPELPPALDDVLARAMAKDPADRYPSCQDLAEDLEDVLAGRPPRHLADWERPPLAEATMVSTGRLRPAEAPPPPRRRRRPLRTFTLLVLLAGLSAFYFRSGHPERFAEAVAPLLVPYLQHWPPAWLPLPPRPAPPAPARGSRGSPSPVKTTAAATPSPAPAAALMTPSPAAGPKRAPAAGGAPSPRPAKSAPPPSRRPAPPRARPTPVPPAGLTVRMEHHLKSGTVRIWLDGRLVVEEELDAQVEKKLMFVPLRKGVVEEQLKVPPGRHVLRVQVKWDDNVETKRISGTFRSGATRQLEIRVSRLRGSLSVEWK